jgi:Tol biopolymer transport system component
MSYKNLSILLPLILLIITGCIPDSDFGIQISDTPPRPTLEEATRQVPTLPAKQLQLTYIQNQGSGFEELYAIDITCINNNQICFGEPSLILSTFAATTDDKSKPTGYTSGYSWSSDGKRIAISAGGDIFIGDMDTQEWDNITKNIGVSESDPIWTFDSKYIFYRACSYEVYNGCRLLRFNRENDEASILLESISSSIDSYSVSPDGQTIVYTPSNKDDKGYSQLFISNLDGSNSRQITSEEGNSSMPSFSPDGQQIVFVRTSNPNDADSGPRSKIIVKDLASGDEKDFAENFDGEIYSPTFLSVENWIMFYSFDISRSASIFAVSLEQNKLLQVTNNNFQNVNPSWRLLSER